MNGKSQPSPTPWVDPDDAPALTDDFFQRGAWRIGDTPVTSQAGSQALRQTLKRGRPPSDNHKLSVTVRYDAEVISAFKATGKGWQTRMNDALKEWLASHPA